jgi:hypothetical protein
VTSQSFVIRIADDELKSGTRTFSVPDATALGTSVRRRRHRDAVTISTTTDWVETTDPRRGADMRVRMRWMLPVLTAIVGLAPIVLAPPHVEAQRPRH